jgi:hypothetical protein
VPCGIGAVVICGPDGDATDGFAPVARGAPLLSVVIVCGPAGPLFCGSAAPVGLGPPRCSFAPSGVLPGLASRAAMTPLPVKAVGLTVAAIVGRP